MARLRGAPSKRMSSKQRHKIERKKREHKRDLKKAAKALKKSGLGPKRSKKSREIAKLALQISNTHPDKEQILNQVLQARETARVIRAERRSRKGVVEDTEYQGDASTSTESRVSNRRQLLYIPVKDSNHFRVQFIRSLEELVFPSTTATSSENHMEIPSAAYVVTLDSRFAVQCIPWSLLDAIIDQSASYSGDRKVLLLFTFTKADLISAPAMVTQVSLVANALLERYPEGLGSHIVAAATPFSLQSDRAQRHFLRILNQFKQSKSCCCKKMVSNLDGKICAFVIGLPGTGRRSLCRILSREANDSSVSTTPLKATQLQLIRSGQTEGEEQVHVKFAIPNAKAVTFVQLPEDAGVLKELRNAVGSDVVFRSMSFIERVPEPETIGCVLFDGVADKVSLAQAFCLPVVSISENSESSQMKGAEKFLRDLGRAVRRDGGFHISPLFSSEAGTMGNITSSHLTAHVGFTSGQQRSQATLLNATYSNATPSKLVHISTVVQREKGKHYQKVSRTDARNALRLGARTFVREMCQSRHVPWAVMRAPGNAILTPEQVSKASEIFNASLSEGKLLGSVAPLKGMEHLNTLVSAFAATLKDIMVFLPNGVVEMSPEFVSAPQYSVENAAEGDEEAESESEDVELASDSAEDGEEEEGDEEGDESSDE